MSSQNFLGHLLFLLCLGSLIIACSLTHISNTSNWGNRKKGKKIRTEGFKYFLPHSTKNIGHTAQLQLLEKAKRKKGQ